MKCINSYRDTNFKKTVYCDSEKIAIWVVYISSMLKNLGICIRLESCRWIDDVGIKSDSRL